MKKYILFNPYFLTGIMQAQDRPQPKPGNAPVVNIKKPQSFVLSNGMKVLVVENHKLPRVSYTLTLDNAPFTEGNKKGVDELTSSLIGNGTKKQLKRLLTKKLIFMEPISISLHKMLMQVHYQNILDVF